MEAIANLNLNLLPPQSPWPLPTLSRPSPPHLSLPNRRRTLTLRAAADGDGASSDGGGDRPVPRVKPPITPPETVEIRFRRGSRKRRQQMMEDGGEGRPLTAKAQPEAPPKKWEDMTLSEKAAEIYMGEKGMLFWLNKLAYASIFVVIGGWILFRFVGPSLNLYQLDTTPLSPTSMFKG